MTVSKENIEQLVSMLTEARMLIRDVANHLDGSDRGDMVLAMRSVGRMENKMIEQHAKWSPE